MERRLAALGLIHRVHFVPGVPRSSRLVDHYLERTGETAASDHRRANVGCLLSHVRAMRTFLRDTPASVRAAIVLEDDVMLHRDWHRRLERVLSNLPVEAEICALSHLTFFWVDSPWAGQDPTQRNLVEMVPNMWGNQMYWVTRAHARTTLDDYQHEIGGTNRAAESLIWRPDGLVARPPLAISDGSSSTIAPSMAGLPVHTPSVYEHWGIDNYLAVEEDRRGFEPELDHPPATICLCMIVKDESRVMDRLADSVRDLIDTWVICDTGSTDGTPERVQEAFKDIPGELFFDEWKDFGTNRTLMLERARGRADYLLILDADHTVSVGGRLPRLTAEAYSLLEAYPLPSGEAPSRWMPRLVRGDLPWRYVGTAHEYLDWDEPRRVEILPLVVVEHHADGDRAGHLDRTRRLLEADLAENPDNPRTVFYLAETNREMGEDARAIELYARRLELGGRPDEMFFSMYRHAELLSRTDWPLGVALLLETWAYRPDRVEPLLALARGYRRRGHFHLGALFGARGREIGSGTPECSAIEYEWAMCAANIGDLAGALEACDHLLRVPSLAPELREEVKEAWQRWRTEVGGSLASIDPGPRYAAVP
jgi:hypothetical protein